MRAFGGIGLGLFLGLLGSILLQWLAQDVLGLWVPMTQADACLVMIIILLCVIVVYGVGRSAPSSPGRADLNGHSARELRRLRALDEAGPASKRRSTTTAHRSRSARERVDVTSVPGRSPKRARAKSESDSPPARRPRT